jgi:hypothetical protein
MWIARGLVVACALFLGGRAFAAAAADTDSFLPDSTQPTLQCADATVQTALLLSTDDKTCKDYGMYEHNDLKTCEKECQGNRKECVKRQNCGGQQCPDPGYCWKCVDHK